MSKSSLHHDCDLCGQPFQFGPHIYRGRPIPSWGKVMICAMCEDSNWDGIVPQSHPRFLALLTDRGVAIKLNDDGWLTIPPRGSQ